jgi:SH3 domain
MVYGHARQPALYLFSDLGYFNEEYVDWKTLEEVEVCYDYMPDESIAGVEKVLVLKKGDQIRVIDKSDKLWWFGFLGNRRGIMFVSIGYFLNINVVPIIKVAPVRSLSQYMIPSKNPSLADFGGSPVLLGASPTSGSVILSNPSYLLIGTKTNQLMEMRTSSTPGRITSPATSTRC